MTTKAYLYAFRTDSPVEAMEWHQAWGGMCDIAASVARHHLTKNGMFHGDMSVRCLPGRSTSELLPLAMGGGYGHKMQVEITEHRMETVQ